MFNSSLYLDPMDLLFERFPPEELIKHGVAKEDVLEDRFVLPKGPNFSNIEKLLHHYTLKATLRKFDNLPIPDGEKILLFTYVIPSGLGDLSMQLYLKKYLQECFPRANIQSISLIDESINIPFPIDGHVERLSSSLSKESIEMIQNASLIIQVPTYFSGLKEIEKLPRTLTIGEYGFIDSEHFSPANNAYCMGLHPLEKGILTLKEVSSLRANNHYVAYLITPWGYETYLHALLDSTKQQEEDLHLHLSSLKVILPILERSDFAPYGIKEIIILDKPHISSLKQCETGKTLTIHVQKGCTPLKMVEKMASSNPFVGCRGNVSFSEALSTGSYFFYDIHEHTMPFYEDLLSVAKNHLPAFPSLHEYLSLLKKRSISPVTIGKEISYLLSDLSFQMGMQRLKAYLYKNFSFNPILERLVKREIYFLHHPFEEIHSEKSLLRGDISLSKYLSNSGCTIP